MYKVNDIVKVAEDNDNECYDSFRDKPLKIVSFITSEEEHMAYDPSMEGMPLYSFETLEGEEIPCALYEYEIEPYTK